MFCLNLDVDGLATQLINRLFEPNPVTIIYYINVVIDLALGAGFELTLSASKSQKIFHSNQFNDNCFLSYYYKRARYQLRWTHWQLQYVYICT